MGKLLARELRKNMTDAERIIWYYLRDRRLSGWKFRRQHPIGPFIVDFICIEKRLIVEVDGGQHNLNPEIDIKRTEYLKERGYRVIRFWNNDVLKETEAVLNSILLSLSDNIPSP
jgi:very-short-patch-repair endonuclease